MLAPMLTGSKSSGRSPPFQRFRGKASRSRPSSPEQILRRLATPLPLSAPRRGDPSHAIFGEEMVSGTHFSGGEGRSASDLFDGPYPRPVHFYHLPGSGARRAPA